jgi:hypothetical protein
MPRGGPRVPKPGKKLGRPPELVQTAREEIKREYHQRMQAWAAAQAIGRDPNMRRRYALEKEMLRLAKKHPPLSFSHDERDEDKLYFYSGAQHLFDPLEAELKSRRNQPDLKAFPPKRAKGPRKRFIRELAKEFRVSERMIVRCIDET